ncbi:putative DUF2815 family protein (plasmid) [Corynebacterium mustelae]|uniref:Putative DUF2815 family protein n=1 Tax=Corynebacterium mustelae TaxID=571915 RepID=A0A0G3GVP8_9CORY|nr:DUF2815 family protein [Corynebacterium mustelae]AKK05214.1 putative DUF2815 family protein [Corynebacterium mustelae]AKK07460.1 putative DUF2815 family protein [Corynebacterium mustelae]
MSVKLVTPDEVRFSYANVWEPRSINGSEKEKYSCSILIPKTATRTLALIEQKIKEALEEGKAKFNGKIPPIGSLKLPLRDGDLEREDEVYAGHYFINANANADYKPQILGPDGTPIIDRNEFYSGCYGRVSLQFYTFNVNGNRGVAAGLGNIMKTRDGENLGGAGVRAEDEFAEYIQAAPSVVATDGFGNSLGGMLS